MAVFGETLRQARAYKGVTLKEAEQATRINRHHLAALEDENFAALPPLIYQRGIVRNYAVFLDLDPNKVLTMFEDAHGSATTTGSIPMAVKPLEMPNHFTPNFAIIAFMVVLSAIVFAWVYSVYRGPADVLPTPTMLTTVTPMTSNAAAAPVLPTATATPVRGDDDDADASADPNQSSSPEAVDPTAETNRPMSEANARRTEVAETQVAERSEPTVEPAEATDDADAAPVADREEPTAPVASTRQSREDREATEVAEQAAAAEQESANATQAAVEESMLTISFTPTATVYLTVYGDGVLLFDGEVAVGTELGPFNAYSYSIYTSDSVNTLINNLDEGKTFYMDSQSFTLP